MIYAFLAGLESRLHSVKPLTRSAQGHGPAFVVYRVTTWVLGWSADDFLRTGRPLGLAGSAPPAGLQVKGFTHPSFALFFASLKEVKNTT